MNESKDESKDTRQPWAVPTATSWGFASEALNGATTGAPDGLQRHSSG